MQKGKLKPEDEKCLQKNFINLKQNIDALLLVDRLYTEGVITLDDKEKIENERTKIKRNDILLHTILDSGPGENFDKFIAALRTNYSYLEIVKTKQPKECEEKSNQLMTKTYGEKSEKLLKLYDITALLVGESKCGKTSTFKTIIRFNKKQNCSMRRMRKEKYVHIRLSSGRKIQLVDSPSIEQFRPNSRKLIHEVQDSIQKVLEGFHAFLLIVKYHKVIEKEDLYIVETIKSLYGPDIVRNYCILVVTHGDILKAENKSFDEWCSGQGQEFKNLYEECGRRAVVIDNTTANVEDVKDILKKLIEKIDDLQFNGRRYTADHFRKAESGRKRMLIEEKKSNILEETAAKCTSMIQLSREITSSVSGDTCTRLETLYGESLELMDSVKMMDEGTNILNNSLSLIKDVEALLSEKLKFLNAKKTERKRLLTILEKEEKKLLKKIDKANEKLKDEEEKLALKQEVLSLKELLNQTRVAVVEPMGNSQDDNLKTDIVKANKIEKLLFNNVRNKNTPTVHMKTEHLLNPYAHTQDQKTNYNETNKNSKVNDEGSLYNGLHKKRNLKCNHRFINITTVILLLMFIFFFYKTTTKQTFGLEWMLMQLSWSSLTKKLQCLRTKL